MTGTRFALSVAAALFVAFVCVNLIAGVWLKTARLDLTENKLYSLSEGSKTVLASLSEPMELRLYASSEAARGDPALADYATRVRTLLQTFSARSRGRLRVVEIDPLPFSEEEEAARLAGLAPVTPPGADPIFLGLAGANSVDDRRVIPFLDPAREPFLEYDITRLIFELDNPDPVRAALITTLPFDPTAASDPITGGRSGQAVFAQQFGALMDVELLPRDFRSIPEDVDLVAVIHPWALEPDQLYALDQFIMAKGRAFIALDPASVLSLGPPDPNPFAPPPPPSASSLDRILQAWGLAMSQDVVLDREGGFRIPAPDDSGRNVTVPYPLFLQASPERMSRESVATAPLRRDLVFGLAGALRPSERPGVTVETLVRTSGETMMMPAEFALQQPDPFLLEQTWQGVQRSEILAVRLSGVLPSAYPEGPPPEAGEPPGEAIAQSRVPAQVVVVSDTDFLLDPFYVNPGDNSFVFDNLFFALNVLEQLGGSDALISLRSRAPAVRRMELVDDLEQAAREAYQRRLEQAQTEQRVTEERLAELASRGRGSGFFRGEAAVELTAEEQTELNRFILRAQQLGQEVRSIRRALRQEVDRLELIVVGANLWLGPLLVAGLGGILLSRRVRRRRSHEGAGA